MFVSNGTLVDRKTVLNLTGPSYFPRVSTPQTYMPPMASHGWPSVYGSLYRSQLWVYVVVSKRARATARLPLPVYERDDLNRPRADDHPMFRLLSNPNPGLSAFALWRWTSSVYDTWADAFWYKDRTGGQVSGLYPLHPTAMTYDDASDSWSFDNGKMTMKDIKPVDLVHFSDFHPDSMTQGMSALEPLRATLENEWNARTATSSFWQRGARPGTYLTHPKNISEGAANRLKRQFDDITAGSTHTGTTVVLEEGMEPRPMMLTAEEAQYIETRKLNREEVCAAYDVPPPVVHILDRATFSNITEQMRSMYRDTMAPHLAGFEATIETDLRAVEWSTDAVYAEFLLDGVLRGDFETRQDALAKATHMTIAEKRKVENLPFIEGTDRIFLNAAEQPMPVPQAGDAPAAPPFQQVGLPALIEAGVISREDARRLLGIDGAAPVVDEDAEVVPLRVARAVLGRLSWQADLEQVDARALIEETGEHAGSILQALALEAAAGGTVAGLRNRIRALTASARSDQ